MSDTVLLFKAVKIVIQHAVVFLVKVLLMIVYSITDFFWESTKQLLKFITKLQNLTKKTG